MIHGRGRDAPGLFEAPSSRGKLACASREFDQNCTLNPMNDPIAYTIAIY